MRWFLLDSLGGGRGPRGWPWPGHTQQALSLWALHLAVLWASWRTESWLRPCSVALPRGGRAQRRDPEDTGGLSHTQQAGWLSQPTPASLRHLLSCPFPWNSRLPGPSSCLFPPFPALLHGEAAFHFRVLGGGAGGGERRGHLTLSRWQQASQTSGINMGEVSGLRTGGPVCSEGVLLGAPGWD